MGGYRVAGRSTWKLGVDVVGLERLRVVLAVAASGRPLRIDLDPRAVARRAPAIVAALVDGLSADPGAGAPRWRTPGDDEVLAGTIAGRLWARLGANGPDRV